MSLLADMVSHHPGFRNSIEFLINVLKCFLDEKQYYEYWGPLLLLDVILWGNKVLCQHNFSFSEVVHFLDTRAPDQDEYLADSGPQAWGGGPGNRPVASAFSLAKPAPPSLLPWCHLSGKFLQRLKLSLLLPSTLWVLEQMYGACQQGLCQI